MGQLSRIIFPNDFSAMIFLKKPCNKGIYGAWIKTGFLAARYSPIFPGAEVFIISG